jgi:hypothetical protein
MKIRRLVVASASIVIAGLAFLSSSQAFDHRDAPFAVQDNASDITDVYAFMRPETNEAGAFVPSDHLVLVMNFGPGAKRGQAFPTGVQYQFSTRFVAPPPELTVTEYPFAFNATCTFSEPKSKSKPQQVTCVVNGIPVVADVETPDAGPENQDIRVYAGVRSDPAFANVPGVVGAAGDAGLGVFEGASKNSFQGQNVMSIVIEVSLRTFYSFGPQEAGSDGGLEAGDGGGDGSSPMLLAVSGETTRLTFPAVSKDGGAP